MFRRIYILSGISIISVVLTHGTTFGLWALYAWTGQYQALIPANFDPFHTPQWFILIFIKQLLSFCVPAFFLITGFFIAYAFDKRSGPTQWEMSKNRVIGLLLPFLVWTVISTVFNTLLDRDIQPLKILLPFFGIGGYWFIPIIIIFYLTARWVFALAKKNWKLLLLGAAALQLLLIAVKFIWFINIKDFLLNYILSVNFDNLILNHLFFFPLGVVLGLHSATFKNWIDQYRFPILTACVILTIVGLYMSGWTLVYVTFVNAWTNFLMQIVNILYSIAVILVFLAFDKVKVPFFNWFSKIGTKSYGIYLTHFFFMTVFSKVIYHYFPALLSQQILFTLLNIFIGLFGSLILLNVVRKLPVERMYAMMFG